MISDESDNEDIESLMPKYDPKEFDHLEVKWVQHIEHKIESSSVLFQLEFEPLTSEFCFDQ